MNDILIKLILAFIIVCGCAVTVSAGVQLATSHDYIREELQRCREVGPDVCTL